MTGSEVVRVRVERDDEEIELVRRPRAAAAASAAADAWAAAPASEREYDTIRADLVGIFRLSRPAPLEGEILEADRELAYIEALGMRNPVRSLGAGRIVTIAATDGAPVEYGQALFLVDRE